MWSAPQWSTRKSNLLCLSCPILRICDTFSKTLPWCVLQADLTWSSVRLGSTPCSFGYYWLTLLRICYHFGVLSYNTPELLQIAIRTINMDLCYNTVLVFCFPELEQWKNNLGLEFLPEKNMCDHLIHKQDWYELLDTACSLMKWDHPSTVYGLNQPLSYCK